MILPNDPDVHQDDTAGRDSAHPRTDDLPYRPYDRRDAPPVCDGEPDVGDGDNHVRPTEGYRYLDPSGDTDGADPR